MYPATPSFELSFPEYAYNVTPSDSVAGPTPFRALLVGGGGTVSLVDLGNNVVSLVVPAGTQLRLGGKLVRATGTTATGIVALV